MWSIGPSEAAHRKAGSEAIKSGTTLLKGIEVSSRLFLIVVV